MKKFQFKKMCLSLLAALLVLSGCASMPAQRNLVLQGDHGRLAARLDTPAHQKEYPLVLILHGFNASKDMPLLTELAKQLNAQGIATLAFDFNGHGQSEGTFVNMTIPNELEDARRVYQYARQLPNVSSVALVGHSQGAVVAAMLAGELGTQQVKALALMSPAPELKEDVAKGNLFGVTFDPKNPPQFITLANGLKVGHDYLQTTQQIPVYEESAKYTGPVLVLHSRDDQLVPYQYGKQMSEVYQNARLETVYGFDHNFTQDTPAADKLVTNFLTEQLLNK